jgi:hypothetical protein
VCVFSRLRLAAVVFVGTFLSSSASGFDIPYKVTTSVAHGPGSCSRPTSIDSFVTTAGKVHLYFELTGAAIGEPIFASWIQPDGGVTGRASWTVGASASCYTGAYLDIATLTASQLGVWRVRVFGNAGDLFNLNFTVTATAGAPTSSGTNPRIDEVEPKRAEIGIETTFTVRGSGFRNGFSGRLRVNNAANQWPLTGTQTIFENANLVKLVVKVGERGDPPADFSLQIINPPPGNEPSNEFTGLKADAAGSPVGRTGAISWITSPPTTFRNAQSFRLKWRLNNTPSVSYSHVHISLDRNDLMATQDVVRPDVIGSTGEQEQDVNPTEVLNLSIAPGTAVYFMVHASDSYDVNYYSEPTESRVETFADSPVSPPPRQGVDERRVYSSNSARATGSSPTPRLNGFTIVVDRDRRSTTASYQYRFTVLSDDYSKTLETAQWVVLLPPNSRVDINSFKIERNANVAPEGLWRNVLSGAETGWDDLSVVAPINEAVDFSTRLTANTLTALGNIWLSRRFPKTSEALDVAGDLNAIMKEIRTFFSTPHDVTPSSDFQGKLRDINLYRNQVMTAAHLGRRYYDDVWGLRFTIICDESAGVRPLFWLKAKNENDEVIGLEFGADFSRPMICRWNQGCSQ